ncbi:MAG: response regulator [Planctomycetota bacterium]|nr:response regulator [Planctomycetota bacterium]
MGEVRGQVVRTPAPSLRREGVAISPDVQPAPVSDSGVNKSGSEETKASLHPPVQDAQPAAQHDAALGVFFSALGEGVAVCDATGEVVWCNASYAKLPGEVSKRVVCEAKDLVKASLPRPGTRPVSPVRRVEIDGPDNASWFEATLQSLDGSGTASPPPQGGALHPDGASGAGPATSPGPGNSNRQAVPRIGVLVRDISAQRRFRQKVNSIDRAGTELVQLDADEILRMHPAERLALAEQKIVKHMRELLQFDHFAIRLLNRKTGRLDLLLHHGMPPEFGDIEIRPALTGNGTSGYVAATGQSYICTDASRDPLFLPGLTGAKSSLTVALRLNERVLGILDIESQQPAAFDEEDRQFAETFARYVTLGLHQLDLLVVERCATNENASRRAAADLSQPLADIVEQVDRMREGGGISPAAIGRLDQIRCDVEAIRASVREIASGPQTILNVDRVMNERPFDPEMTGKRILVADDEERIRKVIGDILRHRGCDVTVVESGTAAIAMLERVSRGEIPGFNLVLSDIKMPDRTGYDVFSAAKRISSGIKVILMTGFGYDPHHSIVRASQEGCKQVLFKPFDATTLLDEVRKSLT